MEIEFLKTAVKESVLSVSKNGGPFGAVIVKDGKIIAQAGNTVTSEEDPTAHAEINTIRMAGKKLGTHDLSGCEIYCSCEPCPMCLGAIYWARLDKIWYANSSYVAQLHGFDDSYIYKEFSLPGEKRSIPSRGISLADAEESFLKWDEKEFKIRY